MTLNPGPFQVILMKLQLPVPVWTEATSTISTSCVEQDAIGKSKSNVNAYLSRI